MCSVLFLVLLCFNKFFWGKGLHLELERRGGILGEGRHCCRVVWGSGPRKPCRRPESGQAQWGLRLRGAPDTPERFEAMCVTGWASEKPFVLENVTLKEGTGKSYFDTLSGKILQTPVTDHIQGCWLSITPQI